MKAGEEGRPIVRPLLSAEGASSCYAAVIYLLEFTQCIIKKRQSGAVGVFGISIKM